MGANHGMIMPIPNSLQVEASEATVDLTDNVKIRKTGNTRTILGYRCDEYEVTEEGSNEISNVWTTEDIDFKANKKLLRWSAGNAKRLRQGSAQGPYTGL